MKTLIIFHLSIKGMIQGGEWARSITQDEHRGATAHPFGVALSKNVHGSHRLGWGRQLEGWGTAMGHGGGREPGAQGLDGLWRPQREVPPSNPCPIGANREGGMALPGLKWAQAAPAKAMQWHWMTLLFTPMDAYLDRCSTHWVLTPITLMHAAPSIQYPCYSTCYRLG